MQMQTQTQMEMQASSHVQRKRKEREIRKRKKYFSKMADNDWAFADSHVWEANANTNFIKWKCFIIQTTVLYKDFQPLGKCVWYR